MVLGPDGPSQRLSVGDSHQEGPLLSGSRLELSSTPGVVETVGVATEGPLVETCQRATRGTV